MSEYQCNLQAPCSCLCTCALQGGTCRTTTYEVYAAKDWEGHPLVMDEVAANWNSYYRKDESHGHE